MTTFYKLKSVYCISQIAVSNISNTSLYFTMLPFIFCTDSRDADENPSRGVRFEDIDVRFEDIQAELDDEDQLENSAADDGSEMGNYLKAIQKQLMRETRSSDMAVDRWLLHLLKSSNGDSGWWIRSSQAKFVTQKLGLEISEQS